MISLLTLVSLQILVNVQIVHLNIFLRVLLSPVIEAANC